VLVIEGAWKTTGISSILEDRDVVVVSASASETLADAIRRVGATDVAAVVLAAPDFVSGQTHAPHGRVVCDDLTDAVDGLHMKAAVVVAACDPREGWYKVDVGLNETAPTLESGALAIRTKVKTLGATGGAPPTRDLREIGALLAVIRMINELGGPAKATPEALDQAMRNFTGPLPLGAGPLDCSPSGKVAERVSPGSCVRFVDVHQFVHEKWIDLPPIDLGS
jgi:hypothetical protein